MVEKATKAQGVAEAVRRARAKRQAESKEDSTRSEQEELSAAAPVTVPAEAAPKRRRSRVEGAKSETTGTTSSKRRVRPSKEAQRTEVHAKRKPGRPRGSKNKTQLEKAAEERARKIAKAAKAGKKAAQRRKGRGDAQAVVKKVRKTKRESKPSTTGQSAPPIHLRLRQLNDKERDVLVRLNGTGAGDREICTIASLAVECFGTFPPKQANSWVRNSLRRLIQGQFVEKIDRGSYRVSESGRRKLTQAT